MIITDTSALLAFFNHRDPAHREVVPIMTAERDAFVVSPYVVAELDHLMVTRLGVDVELAVLAELAGGAWELASFGADDLLRAAEVVERYHDQAIGVADASIVVLADRYRTRTLLTLDHRHFDVLRPLSGGRFSLVP